VIFLSLFYPFILTLSLIWINYQLTSKPKQSVVLPILIHLALGGIVTYLLEAHLPFVILWTWGFETLWLSVIGLLMLNEYTIKKSSEETEVLQESRADLKTSKVLLIILLVIPIAIAVHTGLNYSDYLLRNNISWVHSWSWIINNLELPF